MRLLIPLPKQWNPRQVATIRTVWLCAALLYLGVSEWRVWTDTPNIPITPANMGTGVLAGLAGLLVVQLLAMLVFGFLARGWHLPKLSCPRPTNTEVWLVVGVTAVAIAIRFAALQEVPYGLWFDTAEDGNQALRMLRDPAYRPVFIAEATQLPALFVYFDALSINWFGAEALALRLPAAFFGAAAVPAMWWLGRQLGGPVLGLAAAFALATSRWHTDFSRLAIASIVTPFALALALAATIAALKASGRTPQIALSALAGLAVSLGLWSYPASVLIVPAVIVGIAWWIVIGWLPEWRMRLRRGALVLAIAAASSVVTLAPLIGVAIKDPNTVLQRSQTVAVSGGNATREIYESAIQHVLMYTVSGDRNGRHNTPGRPELGWFSPFFLAGVGAALWRPRSGVFLAIPAALIFLAPGILTLPFEAPQSHRALLGVVPASLLVALPLTLLWSRFRLLAAFLAALFVVAGTMETGDYFRAQLLDASVYGENSLLETQAGRWLRALQPNLPVLAAERFRSHPTVRFLSGDHPSIATPGTAVSEFLPLDGAQPAAVIASWDEQSLFDRARALYTQAPIETFAGPVGQGDPLLFSMFVSQQVQAETRGFLAESDTGSVLTVPAVESSDARAWSAIMRVRLSGEYLIEAGGCQVAIDGEPVLQAGQASASVILARGAHAIHIVRRDTNASPRLQVSLTSAAPPLTFNSPPTGPTEVLFFGLPAPGGLLFTWQIEGQPQQALVDSAPHRGFEGTFNQGRPWTAQWRGRMRVVAAGDYLFNMDVISTATLFIDDAPVLSGSGEKGATLAQGWHTIRIEYIDRDPYAHLILNWRPPGEAKFSAIPDDLLVPALGAP